MLKFYWLGFLLYSIIYIHIIINQNKKNMNTQETNKQTKAISPKNQSNLNKAIQWLEKYNKANDLRNMSDDEGNEKLFIKHEKACEHSYNKFLEYMEELPKSQQNKVYKSNLY